MARVKLENLEKSDFTGVKEADLTGHLQNGNGATAKEKKEVSDKDKDKDKDNKQDAEDYSLHEALNLLKGISIIKK